MGKKNKKPKILTNQAHTKSIGLHQAKIEKKPKCSRIKICAKNVCVSGKYKWFCIIAALFVAGGFFVTYQQTKTNDDKLDDDKGRGISPDEKIVPKDPAQSTAYINDSLSANRTSKAVIELNRFAVTCH